MHFPKNIDLSYQTGWLTPAEGQPLNVTWQGVIYDISWKVTDNNVAVRNFKIAFRSRIQKNILGWQFPWTKLEIDKIYITKWDEEQILNPRHVNDIVSNSLEEGVDVTPEFVRWVLRPSVDKLKLMIEEIDKQRTLSTSRIQAVA